MSGTCPFCNEEAETSVLVATEPDDADVEQCNECHAIHRVRVGTIRYTSILRLPGGGQADDLLKAESSDRTKVVIKRFNRPEVLRPGLDTGLHRAKMEAQALQNAQHPNIVRIYHYVETAAFGALVIEFVHGVTLQKLYERATLPTIEAVVSIVRQLLPALQHIHSLQIYHRDLAPRNILIDKTGHIKLIDFGLSRLHGATQTRLASGGTLNFLAPEQGNDPTDTGIYADQYAAAALIFFLITGRAPHEFASEAAFQIFLRDKTPVSLPTSLAGDEAGERTRLLHALSGPMLRALEFESQRRHESIAEFAGEVAAHLQRAGFGSPDRQEPNPAAPVYVSLPPSAPPPPIVAPAKPVAPPPAHASLPPSAPPPPVYAGMTSAGEFQQVGPDFRNTPSSRPAPSVLPVSTPTAVSNLPPSVTPPVAIIPPPPAPPPIRASEKIGSQRVWPGVIAMIFVASAIAAAIIGLVLLFSERPSGPPNATGAPPSSTKSSPPVGAASDGSPNPSTAAPATAVPAEHLPPPAHSEQDSTPEPSSSPEVCEAPARRRCPGGQCVFNGLPEYGCYGQSCQPCFDDDDHVATPRCDGTKCAIQRCDTDYKDCDKSASSGCETELGTAADCGDCRDKCLPGAHKTAKCQKNEGVYGCKRECDSLDWGDCDTNPTDCERKLTTKSDCGSCGAKCEAQEECRNRSCECVPGALDCRSDVPGCETSIDKDNCNGCGTKCPGVTHGKAICTPQGCGFTCNATFQKIGDTCVCGSNFSEVDGACTCQSPNLSCGSSCCPAPANGTAVCTPGNSCGVQCNAGFENVDGVCQAAAPGGEPPPN
ncbi:MAG: serine/threonine protein kinase [Polyangiaceae bacterium]|nr:serine/threonine protein kinase [Polyangiaceae bacterium]